MIVGPVRVTDNPAGVEVAGTFVIGPLKVTNNSGGTTVTGNTVIGPLTVTGNTRNCHRHAQHRHRALDAPVS